MKTFIISLYSYSERRIFQQHQALSKGLDYEFIEAIDAAELSINILQNAANNWSRPIVAKDVGCFLSHRKAWEAVVKHRERAIISEDDVVLSDRFNTALTFLSSIKHEKYSIYDLEYVPRNHLLAKKSLHKTEGTGVSATTIYQNKTGLGCYSIDPETATRLLEETEDYAMVDAFVWTRNWVRQVQIEPAPAIQLMYLEGPTKKDRLKKESLDCLYSNNSKLRARLISLRKLFISAKQLLRGKMFGMLRPIQVNLEDFTKP